jgi:hypothetical protein
MLERCRTLQSVAAVRKAHRHAPDPAGGSVAGAKPGSAAAAGGGGAAAAAEVKFDAAWLVAAWPKVLLDLGLHL